MRGYFPLIELSLAVCLVSSVFTSFSLYSAFKVAHSLSWYMQPSMRSSQIGFPLMRVKNFLLPSSPVNQPFLVMSCGYP